MKIPSSLSVYHPVHQTIIQSVKILSSSSNTIQPIKYHPVHQIPSGPLKCYPVHQFFPSLQIPPSPSKYHPTHCNTILSIRSPSTQSECHPVYHQITIQSVKILPSSTNYDPFVCHPVFPSSLAVL